MIPPAARLARRRAGIRVALFTVLVGSASLVARPPAGIEAQVPGQAAPAGGGVARPANIQLGVTVQPESVTVGTPFIVSVRVRAPLGAEVDFPAGPDSTFAIQALDPVSVSEAADSLAVDRTARYRMAAWDVGSQPITFQPLTVRTATDVRRLTIEVPSIFVMTVLPEDTAQRIPRPARELFAFPVSRWLWWLLALAAAAILGGLLWWWWHRRTREAAGARTDPFVEAEAAFARIDALGLIEAGERGRYVALVTEVLRDYLAAREPAATTALTSRELATLLVRSPVVPVERLGGVLQEADLVKFAARPITAQRATELGGESRAIVRDVEAARAAAVAEAVARAEREEQSRQDGGRGPSDTGRTSRGAAA